MQRFVSSIIPGLLLGAVLALFVGWVVAPVQYTDGTLADLSRAYKDDYTVMVAASYQADCDLSEALNRLGPLRVKDIPSYVFDVTQRYLSQSGTGKEADVRHLISLSRAMNTKDKDTALMRALMPDDTPCIPLDHP
ncbi:MAG TPA: hypothetical protein VMT34_13575 [Aggregatilineales bacterium]|nr:hypothetical protein [Aggregatilineales bacterium]